MRFRAGVLADEKDALAGLDAFLEEFAGARGVQHRTIAGHAVSYAAKARGTNLDAIAWHRGDDFVVVTSLIAPALARAYL